MTICGVVVRYRISGSGASSITEILSILQSLRALFDIWI